MQSSTGNGYYKAFSNVGDALGLEHVGGSLTMPKTKFDECLSVLTTKANKLVTERGGWGTSDPLNVFIKREPHKLSKLQAERYRLISATSLDDTLIDRILFGDFVDKLLSMQTDCRVGWSWLKGGWRQLPAKFNRPFCVDKSAWDWTMQAWIVECFLSFITKLIDVPEWYHDLMRYRLKCLFATATFMFSDGTLVRQGPIGIMKSGCFLTIIMNSFAQMMLHVRACQLLDVDPDLNWPDCLGDDTIQDEPADPDAYMQALATAGCVPKLTSRGVEFCGLQMTHKRVLPLYWKKHLFKFMHHEPTTFLEFLEAMQILYRYDPLMVKLFRSAAIASRGSRGVLTQDFIRNLVG